MTLHRGSIASLPSPTAHALKRIQQRGIPPLVVDWLHRFGTSERCGRSERLVFDKASRKRIGRNLGPDALRSAEPWLGTYAVVSDAGDLLTVGHRTKRFLRK